MCLPPKTITAFNFYPPSLLENPSTTPNSSHSELSDNLFFTQEYDSDEEEEKERLPPVVS